MENSKYDVHFCHCGRIHFLPEEKIEKAIEEDKEFVYICGGCGTITAIGANIGPDWYSEDPDAICYDMYSSDRYTSKDKSITKEFFDKDGIKKAVSELYYSQGQKVFMMNGYRAIYFSDGIFSNEFNYSEAMSEIYDYSISHKEEGLSDKELIVAALKECQRKCTTVDTTRLFNQLDEDKLEALSCYYIPAFDWSRTKYENEWNVTKKEDKDENL